MFSIKGIFIDNKIKLSEPLKVKQRTNVIVTFLDEDNFHQDNSSAVDDFPETDILFDDDDRDLEDPESDLLGEGDGLKEDYTKIRKHKRYTAKGNISLIEGGKERLFPLFDYSAGGLSFISKEKDDIFQEGRLLTASIKDPIEQDTSVLDFEFEIARVENMGERFKIGCKFIDEIDEEIWHSLMS